MLGGHARAVVAAGKAHSVLGSTRASSGRPERIPGNMPLPGLSAFENLLGEVSEKILLYEAKSEDSPTHEAKIALPGAPRGDHAERNGARLRAFANDAQVYICIPKRFRG